MSRRLGLSLLALAAGVALLVSAASASPHGASKGGGELRLMWGIEPDSVDTARAGAYGGSLLVERDLREALQNRSRPGHRQAAGRSRDRGRLPEDHERGRTYTFELERTFRFDTASA